jgi:hypothetical protein
MIELKGYFDAISKLNESTWNRVLPFFEEKTFSKSEYFIEAHKTARQIAFLKSGVVRAFFINQEAKDYNKQFFVGPSIIGAYTSLLTGNVNLIAQQALTDCVIYTCDYKS